MAVALAAVHIQASLVSEFGVVPVQELEDSSLNFTTLGREPRWLAQLALWQEQEWQNFDRRRFGADASADALPKGESSPSVLPPPRREQLRERCRKLRTHLQSPIDLSANIHSLNSLPQTLLLSDGQQLLGCVSLVLYRNSHAIKHDGAGLDGSGLASSGATVWLSSLYVTPQWRHRGLGRQLVRRVELLARGYPLTQLKLFTDNRGLFYRQLGWREEGLARLRGREVQIMVRNLSD